MNQNPAFVVSPEDLPVDVVSTFNGKEQFQNEKKLPYNAYPNEPKRMQWGNQIEFLMSCIATSVGLGNVWRFPFVAYQNGGGAFLIPYIIALLIVGKPMYYLEGVIGQFSSRNSIRVWSLSPAMKGTGYAQTILCIYVLSYYVSIVALCMFYLAISFQRELPWAVCREEWPSCVPSGETKAGDSIHANATSSAELYFIKTVLQQSDGIERGLGLPIWYLAVCLFVCWLIIFIIVARGVKSVGKAAYFLALFPYVVMLILLITTCVLPGAGDGILFLLTPHWGKLTDLDVWYAAITQVFFSLSVCSGSICMFSSYSSFRHNVYRDAMIVTTLDTFTSLLSGITIFGILGNLAYNLDKPIGEVVGSGGTSLAFVSYPDAIIKTFQPQLLSVLFFLMMTVLGIGSAAAVLQTINTVLIDSFPRVNVSCIAVCSSIVGFLSGLIYVTPGGQYILELVDYYGCTFLLLFIAICEIIGIVLIYGLENLCVDLEFMLNQKISVFWRICWGVVTPVAMLTVFIYAFISSEELLFAGEYVYPTAAYVSGYIMMAVGMLIVPVFMFIRIYKYGSLNILSAMKRAFSPKESWGPRNTIDRREWADYKSLVAEQYSRSQIRHVLCSLFGIYKR